jgi:S1-C subfamily serine protease
MKKKLLLLILLVSIVGACATENEKIRSIRKDAKEALNKDYKDKPTESYARVGFRQKNLTVYTVDNNAIKYGLKPGDKIIALNGQQVKNYDEYSKIIKSVKIGDEVTLRVQRNYSELDIVAKTIDGKPYVDSWGKILKFTKNGDWQECIDESNKMILEYGNLYEFQSIKSNCLYCIFSSNGSANLSDVANATYVRERLLIKEASYVPGEVERIRSNVLGTVDWLSRIGFRAYATDLIKYLDDATELNTKAPIAQDNVITKSTGTGFAISEDGLIVTAHHVVKEASSIKIHLNNGSVVKANPYKNDPSNDIAILKIGVPTTNYLPIAPLRTAKTGERVFTIGFPISSVLGQEAKYTEGVISALSGIASAESFLQITVPVQPGNSGGPLVNENGYVVGIISSSAAILSFLANTGTIPQNINWAVKADYLRPLVDLPSDKAIKLNRDELIEKAKRSVVLIEATNQ